MEAVDAGEKRAANLSFTKERVQRDLSETGWNYQTLAARTIPEYASVEAQAFHAVFGVIAEVQEAYDAWDYYQTRHWAPEGDTDPEELNEMVRHFYRELGDICWMCAEMYSAYGIDMQVDYPWIFYSAATVNANWRYHSPAIGIGNIFDRLRCNAACLAADFQHTYQGRPIGIEHIRRILRTMLGEVACLAAFTMASQGQDDITPLAAMDAVLQTNIVKLRKRYPGAGWELERDINREEGDV